MNHNKNDMVNQNQGSREEQGRAVHDVYQAFLTHSLDMQNSSDVQVVLNAQDMVLRSFFKNYLVVYLIDINSNHYVTLSSIEKVTQVVSQFHNAQIAMNQVVEKIVQPPFQQNMRAFVDLKTLPQRLKDTHSVTMDYQGSLSGWCCARFMPGSYDEHGILKEVIFTVEHINNKKMPSQFYYKALHSTADFIYYFDLTEGIIGKDIPEAESQLIPDHPGITLPVEYDAFVQQFLASIGWQPIKNHTRIYNRAEILEMYNKGVMRFHTEYYAQNTHCYFRSEFFLIRNEENEHVMAMVVRSNITEEYEKTLRAQKSLKKAQEAENLTRMALMACAERYLNVYIVNLADNLATIVKQDGYLPENHVYTEKNTVIYDISMEGYIQSRVAEEDRERMRQCVTLEQIRKNLAERTEYSFPYHIVKNGEWHDYECRFIRTEKEGIAVLGFANIDALMVEEKRQKEIYRQAVDGMRKSQIFLDAISGSYDNMVVYNLTRDTYTSPVKDDVLGWNHAAQGRYSELVSALVSCFPTSVQKEKAAARSIPRQLELYHSGERYWEERHQLYDAFSKLHWIQERVVYTTDPESGDVLGISLSSVIDEDVQKESRYTQVTEALSKDYTNVYLLNPRKDEITPIHLRGYVVDGLNRTLGTPSPYWALVDAYAKARVYEADRERFCTSLTPEAIEKGIEGKDELIFTYRIVDEGEIRDYQVKIIPAETDGVYILAFKNIDAVLVEERRRQKLYEEALAEAEKANRAKRDFLSRMSHDIRTPINGIVGMAHIMKTQMDSPERVVEGIEQIEQLSHHLELLINDVLDMSRIESGKIELSHEAIDLRALMKSVIPSIHALAAANSVSIQEMRMDVQNQYVLSSPSHIQRICMNVISNAIKYNREGGSVLCTLQELPLDDNHSNYAFTVTDTGIGMSEEFQRHIFEPFVRAQKHLETTYNGTGLGMSITKEFVESMGGTIEIKSKQGVGTTVRFTLPLEHCKAGTNTIAESPKVSLQGKRVLLAEDNKVNLKFARFLLEEEDAEVDVALNGQEAVEAFQASRTGSYDLILMDVMMPVMDGVEATKIIRSLDRDDAKTVPILAMSANAFVEDVQRCLEAGMNDHIAKPLNIASMKEKISRTL